MCQSKSLRGGRWDDVQLRSPKSKQQSQKSFRRMKSAMTSRRKAEVVKSYRKVKTTKEKRHAIKTLEKRDRRSLTYVYGNFEGVEDTSEVDQTASPILKNEENRELVASSEHLSETVFESYQLFGGILKMQLFEDISHFPTIANNAETLASLELTSVDCTLQVPLLVFTASPIAKTLMFLQQELDILQLLSFEGTPLDDIPLLFFNEYGTDINLPESLTPEAMLLLSQRVFFYDWNDSVKCALKKHCEYSNQEKESIMFFVKQEFRILSLLGKSAEGLWQSELFDLYDKEFGSSIKVPPGKELSDMLLRSHRVSIYPSGAAFNKFQLIPYSFL